MSGLTFGIAEAAQLDQIYKLLFGYGASKTGIAYYEESTSASISIDGNMVQIKLSNLLYPGSALPIQNYLWINTGLSTTTVDSLQTNWGPLSFFSLKFEGTPYNTLPVSSPIFIGNGDLMNNYITLTHTKDIEDNIPALIYDSSDNYFYWQAPNHWTDVDINFRSTDTYHAISGRLTLTITGSTNLTYDTTTWTSKIKSVFVANISSVFGLTSGTLADEYEVGEIKLDESHSTMTGVPILIINIIFNFLPGNSTTISQIQTKLGDVKADYNTQKTILDTALKTGLKLLEPNITDVESAKEKINKFTTGVGAIATLTTIDFNISSMILGSIYVMFTIEAYDPTGFSDIAETDLQNALDAKITSEPTLNTTIGALIGYTKTNFNTISQTGAGTLADKKYLIVVYKNLDNMTQATDFYTWIKTTFTDPLLENALLSLVPTLTDAIFINKQTAEYAKGGKVGKKIPPEYISWYNNYTSEFEYYKGTDIFENQQCIDPDKPLLAPAHGHPSKFTMENFHETQNELTQYYSGGIYPVLNNDINIPFNSWFTSPNQIIAYAHMIPLFGLPIGSYPEPGPKFGTAPNTNAWYNPLMKLSIPQNLDSVNGTYGIRIFSYDYSTQKYKKIDDGTAGLTINASAGLVTVLSGQTVLEGAPYNYTPPYFCCFYFYIGETVYSLTTESSTSGGSGGAGGSGFLGAFNNTSGATELGITTPHNYGIWGSNTLAEGNSLTEAISKHNTVLQKMIPVIDRGFSNIGLYPYLMGNELNSSGSVGTDPYVSFSAWRSAEGSNKYTVTQPASAFAYEIIESRSSSVGESIALKFLNTAGITGTAKYVEETNGIAGLGIIPTTGTAPTGGTTSTELAAYTSGVAVTMIGGFIQLQQNSTSPFNWEWDPATTSGPPAYYGLLGSRYLPMDNNELFHSNRTIFGAALPSYPAETLSLTATAPTGSTPLKTIMITQNEYPSDFTSKIFKGNSYEFGLRETPTITATQKKIYVIGYKYDTDKYTVGNSYSDGVLKQLTAVGINGLWDGSAKYPSSITPATAWDTGSPGTYSNWGNSGYIDTWKYFIFQLDNVSTPTLGTDYSYAGTGSAPEPYIDSSSWSAPASFFGKLLWPEKANLYYKFTVNSYISDYYHIDQVFNIVSEATPSSGGKSFNIQDLNKSAWQEGGASSWTSSGISSLLSLSPPHTSVTGYPHPNLLVKGTTIADFIISDVATTTTAGSTTDGYKGSSGALAKERIKLTPLITGSVLGTYFPTTLTVYSSNETAFTTSKRLGQSHSTTDAVFFDTVSPTRLNDIITTGYKGFGTPCEPTNSITHLLQALAGSATYANAINTPNASSWENVIIGYISSSTHGYMSRWGSSSQFTNASDGITGFGVTGNAIIGNNLTTTQSMNDFNSGEYKSSLKLDYVGGYWVAPFQIDWSTNFIGVNNESAASPWSTYSAAGSATDNWKTASCNHTQVFGSADPVGTATSDWTKLYSAHFQNVALSQLNLATSPLNDASFGGGNNKRWMMFKSGGPTGKGFKQCTMKSGAGKRDFPTGSNSVQGFSLELVDLTKMSFNTPDFTFDQTSSKALINGIAGSSDLDIYITCCYNGTGAIPSTSSICTKGWLNANRSGGTSAIPPNGNCMVMSGDSAMTKPDGLSSGPKNYIRKISLGGGGPFSNFDLYVLVGITVNSSNTVPRWAFSGVRIGNVY